MKKKLLIGILLVIGVLVVIFISTSPKSNQTETANGTKKKSEINIPTGPTIDSQSVTIPNVYLNAVKVNDSQGALVVHQEGYDIVYEGQTDEFIITILKTPFDQWRTTAEKAFINKLGITQDEACTLKVSVSTPRYVSEENSGYKYPLSFCEPK